MIIFLIALALLVVAGLCLYRGLTAAAGQGLSGPGGSRVVIIIGNQEPWIEGFVRKLFCITGGVPRQEVLLVDDFSRDGTLEVLKRLQKYYPFEILPGGRCAGRTVEGAAEAGELCFDVRGLRGKELLNAPLFCRLSRVSRR